MVTVSEWESASELSLLAYSVSFSSFLGAATDFVDEELLNLLTAA